MSANKKNHLASCGYLRGFTAADGRLTAVNIRSRTVYQRRPEDVAFRNHFWGKDQALRDEVEQKFASVETEVPRILGAMVASGLPASGSADRGLLLEFLAMHFVRNPTWRGLIATLLERRIIEQGHDAPEYEGLRRVLRSDRHWIDALLRQMPQVASVLGSAQWALLRFNGPWLLTCDQPLVPVPFLPPGMRVPGKTTQGLLETTEFRFVVDPTHALILSWFDAPDWAEWIDADPVLAADINRSIAGNTDVEYFHHPDQVPMFVAPPWMPTDECNPVSSRLHPGYDQAAATGSERRRRASEILRGMVENEITNEIRTVTVTEPRAA
jgi:hypothetical protein